MLLLLLVLVACMVVGTRRLGDRVRMYACTTLLTNLQQISGPMPWVVQQTLPSCKHNKYLQ